MKSLNIVAHPDDDLLFLNPDIIQDLDSGGEATVVYLTAGDDARPQDYYDRRLKAAHATWGNSLSNVCWRFRSNSFRIGDKYGDFYKAWNMPDHTIYTIDGNAFRHADIVNALGWLITVTRPELVRIQDPDVEPAIEADSKDSDHVDHIYGAKFVQEAAKRFSLPVFAYTGYPIRYQAPNVSPELTAKKKDLWRKYQAVDTEVAGEIWDIALDKCYKRQLQ